jgi:hypothetical protein
MKSSRAEWFFFDTRPAEALNPCAADTSPRKKSVPGSPFFLSGLVAIQKKKNSDASAGYSSS